MNNLHPHILIVDDDAIDRAVISDILTKAHYQVSEAIDGEKALQFLAQNTPKIDAIILDRMMPKLSGMDVLYQLCLKPATKYIPVIMLTAHAERSEQKHAYTYGAFDFIFKPVDEIILLNSLKRALMKKMIKKPEETFA